MQSNNTNTTPQQRAQARLARLQRVEALLDKRLDHIEEQSPEEIDTTELARITTTTKRIIDIESAYEAAGHNTSNEPIDYDIIEMILGQIEADIAGDMEAMERLTPRIEDIRESRESPERR